ncbi:MAG: hypothetical protein LBF81_01920 [Prevotellaceae bacterium]|nr:hypothetical protein [Prevotellaceae bacterium]
MQNGVSIPFGMGCPYRAEWGIHSVQNRMPIPNGAARHEPRSGGICSGTQEDAKQQVQGAADFSTPLRSARNDAIRHDIASGAKQSGNGSRAGLLRTTHSQ